MNIQDMTVQEYANHCAYSKLWLCPHEVRDTKLAVDPILSGLECTIKTIPEEIRDKKILKHFVENGIDCIVWMNE